MTYTVGQIAELLQVPPSTIRFYDKNGLLPFVERTPGGIRRFTESDLRRLENILLLRRFGLSVREVELFVQLEEEGEATLSQRLTLLERRQKALEEEIQELTQICHTLKDTCRRFREREESK